MDLGISGKKAVVCGASRGLGFACAQSLADEGAAITLVSRNSHNLETAAANLYERTGCIPRTIVADLSKESDCNKLIDKISGLDILVTNAGGPPSSDFRSVTRDQWLSAYSENCLSAIALITGFIDDLIEQPFGRIVNITSMTVRSPVRNLDLSNTSRLALTGFVAGVSRQVAKSGTTINNLLPGPIMTERLADLGELADDLIAQVPMGRAGTPEEFGATCAFLCSQHASYITGQNILVDGGLCEFTV